MADRKTQRQDRIASGRGPRSEARCRIAADGNKDFMQSLRCRWDWPWNFGHRERWPACILTPKAHYKGLQASARAICIALQWAFGRNVVVCENGVGVGRCWVHSVLCMRVLLRAHIELLVCALDGAFSIFDVGTNAYTLLGTLQSRQRRAGAVRLGVRHATVLALHVRGVHL